MATLRSSTVNLGGIALLAAFTAACGDDESGALDDTAGAYYVDCDARAAGDGSIDAPWNSLAAASAVTLTRVSGFSFAGEPPAPER